MRFLHLITSLDLRGGGPAEVVRLLGKIHSEAGHEVEAVSVDDANLPVDAYTFPVHCLGSDVSGYGYSNKLRHWLERNRSRFDVAIVHGLWQYPLHVAYTTLNGHVPYFVYPHGMLDPWFNERFQLKHLKKILYWHLMGRRALDAASSLIFTTDEEMRRSARAFFPYQWHAIVAPLGIEGPDLSLNADDALKSRWPQLAAGKYQLFFGRLHMKKGCDLLLRAFARVEGKSDTALVMAGPGEESYCNELKALATSLGIADRIVWTGMVTGIAKWSLLRGADAFLLPSHQENFAVAVAEAMSAGTPVLISDKVQIASDVLHCGAGLVETDTLNGTIKLLQRWQKLSPEQREQMRHSARKCYLDNFVATEAGRQLVDQIESRLRTQFKRRPRERFDYQKRAV